MITFDHTYVTNKFEMQLVVDITDIKFTKASLKVESDVDQKDALEFDYKVYGTKSIDNFASRWYSNFIDSPEGARELVYLESKINHMLWELIESGEKV